MPRLTRLALAAAAVLATGLACRDAVGPGARAVRSASLNIAAPIADVVAPDGSRLEVDNGVVRITRADGTVALERAFDFPAGQQTVQVALDIPLNAPTEQFTAGIQLFNGQTLLFQTSGPITVSFGSDNPAPQLPAPVFAGPGATVTSLALAPRDTILTVGDSVRFRSTALAGQQPVAAYFVNLSTSDAQVSVGANGFVVAPARRVTIRVRGQVLGTTVRDSTTLTFVPRATAVAIAAGNAQTAVAGAALPSPLRVRVVASDGFGVPNVPVTFASPTSGASVATAVVRTDVDGLAETNATLGPAAGAQSFTATVTGLPVATFAATATAGALATLQVTTAPPPTVFADQPFDVVVLGRDAFNNPTALPNPVVVAFGTRPGTATLLGTLSVAPTGNTATFTGLRASRPGSGGTLRISAGAIAVTTSAFTVSTGPATLLTLAAGSPPASATVGTTLVDSLLFRLLDDRNVPLGGVTLTFTLSGRTGTIARTTAATDTAGFASPGPWRLADLAGANELRANTGALSSGLVSVTGTAGALAALAYTTPPPATVRAESPFAVAVRDAVGNPVALPTPVTIAFGVQPGTATLNGITSVTPTGSAASFSALRASRPGTGGTLVASAGTFSVTSAPFDVTRGPVATLAIASGTVPGAAVVGSTLADSLVWRVTDDLGVPVGGSTVTFALSGQVGSVVRTSAVADTGGLASPGPWTLASLAGPNTITAAVGTVQAAAVTVTGTAGAAATVGVVAGDAQTATVNTAVAVAPQVRVNDAAGNPVAGVNVTFAVASGGGTLTGATATTDVTGRAAVGSWTLGTTAGPNTLTVTAGALSPLTVTATGTPAAPASLTIVTGSGQSAVAGTAVSIPPRVRVRDAFANAVSGVAVTFAPSGTSTVQPTTPVATNASGEAAVTSWTLGTATGAYTLVASVPSLTDVTFTATATAAGPPTLTVEPVDQYTRLGEITRPIVVTARDGGGAPLAGVVVTYSGPATDAAGGTTSFVGAQVTDATGRVSITGWRPGPDRNRYFMSITGSGIVTTAIASAYATNPPSLLIRLPDSTTTYAATSGTPLAVPLAVQARDEALFGWPVPGARLTMTLERPNAGGAIETIVRSLVADDTGYVALPLADCCVRPGTVSVTVGGDGVPPLRWRLLVSDGAPPPATPTQVARIDVVSGNGQVVPVGTTLPQGLTFAAFDSGGRRVAGTIEFRRVGPASDTTLVVLTADAAGVFSLAPWAVSSTAGLTTILADFGGRRAPVASVTGAGAVAFITTTLPASIFTAVNTPPVDATAFVVRAFDALGTPVPQAAVTWTVTAPGGANLGVTNGVVTASADGTASIPWPALPVAGTYTLTAAVGTVTRLVTIVVTTP